jgi:hypothetical protein
VRLLATLNQDDVIIFLQALVFFYRISIDDQNIRSWLLLVAQGKQGNVCRDLNRFFVQLNPHFYATNKKATKRWLPVPVTGLVSHFPTPVLAGSGSKGRS